MENVLYIPAFCHKRTLLALRYIDYWRAGHILLRVAALYVEISPIRQEEKMKELDVLHSKIGQILVDSGSAKAQKIVTRAKLSLEGDVCDYEFDYINSDGKENWFIPDKLTGYDLRLLLVELREFYVKNNLTNGKPVWSEGEVVVDLQESKIFFDFKYYD
jgi:hypothetical protein